MQSKYAISYKCGTNAQRIISCFIDLIFEDYIYALGISLEWWIYTADVSLVTIYIVKGGTKGKIEVKIVEILTEATIDDTEEVLTKVLLGRLGNANNNANDCSS